MNLKATNRLLIEVEHPYFAVIYAIYLIRKRCYCSENRAMPLKTSIRTEIYCITAASRGTPCNSTAFLSPIGLNLSTAVRATMRVWPVLLC